MRPLLLIALLLIFVTSALAQTKTYPDRETTSIERAYVGLALDQKNPAVCAKIAPNAVETDRMLQAGRQVYYVRSACYMYLAQMELKPEYCINVKQASDRFFATGWHFKKATCEKLAKSEKPVMIAYALDYRIVMKALGYTDGELKNRTWSQFYNEVRTDNSMANRIQRMPDFTNLPIMPE